MGFGWLCSGLGLVSAALGVEGIATDFPPPQPIVNGQDAQPCDFPATVALVGTSGGQYCSASVVHPRVVVLAAHCIEYDADVPDHFAFGEDAVNPEETVPIANCEVHPDYELYETPNPPTDLARTDLAFCVLGADAPDVPMVPLLMGCEVEELEPGREVTVAGFGRENEDNLGSNGTKHWTTQTIETVDNDVNDVVLLGSGDSSVCFGDSGGPVYIRLADGSWRVAGVASTIHPASFGGAMGAACGYGAVYDMFYPEMEWIEQQSGYDVTPCHDADGTWNPDERCDGFPTTVQGAERSWAQLCLGRDAAGLGESCGPALGSGTTGTGGGSSTGDGVDSTGGSVDSTGGSVDSSTGTTGQTGGASGSTGHSEPAPPSLPPAAHDDTDAGCGCRSTTGGNPWLAFVVLGAFLRRVRSFGDRAQRSI